MALVKPSKPKAKKSVKLKVILPQKQEEIEDKWTNFRISKAFHAELKKFTSDRGLVMIHFIEKAAKVEMARIKKMEEDAIK